MALMPKIPFDQIRARVAERTKQTIEEWSAETGIKQERMVGAILDRWAGLDELEQRTWLIGLSDEDVLRRADAIRRSRDDRAAAQAHHRSAVSAVAAEADSEVHDGKQAKNPRGV